MIYYDIKLTERTVYHWQYYSGVKQRLSTNIQLSNDEYQQLCAASSVWGSAVEDSSSYQLVDHTLLLIHWPCGCMKYSGVDKTLTRCSIVCPDSYRYALGSKQYQCHLTTNERINHTCCWLEKQKFVSGKYQRWIFLIIVSHYYWK